jgi:hypothetical protein
MNAGQDTHLLERVVFPAPRAGSVSAWVRGLWLRTARALAARESPEPAPLAFAGAASLVHAPERWHRMTADELEGQLALVLAGFRRGQPGLSESDIAPFVDHAFEHLSVDRRVRFVTRLVGAK